MDSIYTDAHHELTRLLTEARLRAGLTQAELAGRLGKPQPFVSRLESNQRRVDVVEFLCLAQALGADPVAILAAVRRHLPSGA